MKNLKVSMKLIVSFFVLIVLAVAIGVIGIIGMGSLNNSQSTLYDNNLIAVEAMGNLRELFANERNSIRTITLHQDDSERVNSIINGFADYDSIAAENFALYETTINDESAEESYYAAKHAWTEEYAQLKRDCFALMRAGQFDEAYDHYQTEGASIIAPISNGFAESAAINKAWAEEADADGGALYTSLTIILVIVLVASVMIALFFAFYISRLISKPLTTLSAFMHKAGSTGDISLTPEDGRLISEMGQVKDEIGQTISNSATFVGHVTTIAKELEAFASGDLTVAVEVLSDADILGTSLKRMGDNLGSMFGNIRSSTSQVSTGAKQVADGAQSLAQGATEQAASIQQLSSSISDIAEKTKKNAETAERTSRLSVSIKDNAEKGSRQMNDMIAAVKEINDASQSISKIIKTIDDIAFQTNILALNAAVEAARAGQHGKGFAVVAEEVRNLASKSAEAAKDTGVMIQNSMEKAELGTRIAGDTATSLRDIVSGINESSQLISEIAVASGEQTLGISQINTGIDQVAQVVQQNSATAEQSAAASEQMSSQSTMLEELVAQFKLRGSDMAYQSLPSGTRATQGSFAQLPATAEFGKY